MKLTSAIALPILFLGVNSHALESSVDLSDMQNYFNQNIVLATQPISPQVIDTYAVLFAEALATDDLSFATGFLTIVLTNEKLLLHEKTMEIGKNLCYDYLESKIVKEVTEDEFNFRWSGVFQNTLTLAEKMKDMRSVGDLFTRILKEYDLNPTHNSVEWYIAVLANQEDEFDNVLAQTLRYQINTQFKNSGKKELILIQLNDAVERILYSTRMKIREVRRRETKIRNK